MAALCQELVPAERLRPRGDAVERGEAEARQEVQREAAILARYEVTALAGNMVFAPYDVDEERLSLVEPMTLRLGNGAAILVATLDRALPVEVDPGLVRRLLKAQQAGQLGLRLVFDLPDDATCASEKRGRRVTLGVEPVEWTWLEGEAPLARGGVSADWPGVSATLGAQAAVEVGEPIAGPREVKKAVEARRGPLEACYEEALKGDPGLDGVLVLEVGAKVSVSLDSTGSGELSLCVEKALSSLPRGIQGSVPLRFELFLPGAVAPLGVTDQPN